MVHKKTRRSLLKKLLGFPLVFLMPTTQVFHFQYIVSFPKDYIKSRYLTYQKLTNQRKIAQISQELINKKGILKISEYWFADKVKVNVVFNSKNSFKLWRAIIEDSKTFNTRKLNNLGFRIKYTTKI